MKNVFANWNWEDTWQTIALAVVVLLIVLGAKAIVVDHIVRFYYLDEEHGSLVIKGDIPWCEDTYLRLDRSVTYEGAIQMVDDLNRGLGYVAPVDTLFIK